MYDAVILFMTNLNQMKKLHSKLLFALILGVTFVSKAQHSILLYENVFEEYSSDSVFLNDLSFFKINPGIDSSFDGTSFLTASSVDNQLKILINTNWSDYDSVKISFNAYWKSSANSAFDLRDSQYNILFEENNLIFGSLSSNSKYELNITDWLDQDELILSFLNDYEYMTQEQLGFFFIDNLKIFGYSNIVSINNIDLTSNNRTLLYYIDMSGKKTSLENTPENTMLIAVYGDGTKELIIKNY